MDPHMNMTDWNGNFDVGIASLPDVFQDSALDIDILNSRAGLYIYLNAALTGKPSFDDDQVTRLLATRYDEDIDALISDLILASFDVLANAINRNESSRTRTLIRSFVINKLPLFLSEHYAAMVMSPEQCIRQAIGWIDPLSSQSFDVLSETRVDFLFACALHELLPEPQIKDILGETPLQGLPSSGKYLTENIIEILTIDTAQIDNYVAQLEDTDGNSGAIARAIFQLMQTMATNNDTMSLKTVCNALSRKPAAIDILLLFTQSDNLLRPLCSLLDNWSDDPSQDDQSREHQFVYDEFGAILLFVCAARHRFDLSAAEMGLDPTSTFLATYFSAAKSPSNLETLTDKDRENLENWLKGLYETGEISDDLMSSCSPSSFHLLSSSLLSQALAAAQAEVITPETLKSGLEYLLEPFLLPSLVASLSWLSDHLWATYPDNGKSKLDISPHISTLLFLVSPPKLSTEASGIHTAVLHIISPRLDPSLNHLLPLFPNQSKQIKSLLASTSPYLNDSGPRSLLRELSTWSTAPNGGMLASLRKSLSTLTSWSTSSSTTSSAPSPTEPLSPPPNCTSQILFSALSILGAHHVLTTLLTFLLTLVDPSSTETTTAPPPANTDAIALDIASAAVLAARHKLPSSLQQSGCKFPMALHTLLQTQYLNANEIAKTDLARATLLVKLYRRVQALAGEELATVHDAAGEMGGLVGANEALPNDLVDGMAPGAAGKMPAKTIGLGVSTDDAAGAGAHEIDDVLAEAGAAAAAGMGLDAAVGLGGGQSGGMVMDVDVDVDAMMA